MVRYRLDGHVHTRSYNNHHLRNINPGIIIDSSMKNGLDVLIVTDINEDSFYDEIRTNPNKNIPFSYKLLDGFERDKGALLIEKDERKLYLFRGLEAYHPQGHLLVWGVQDKFLYNPNYTHKDIIKKTHDMNGIVGPSHPFNPLVHGISMTKLDELVDEIDFIEVRNGNNIFGEKHEIHAEEYSMQHQTPRVGNSDAHRPKDIGCCYTSLNLFKDPLPENVWTAVKDSILSDNCSPRGGYIGTIGVLDWLVLGKIRTEDTNGLGNNARRILRKFL